MIVNVLFYFVFSLPASRSGGTATKIYFGHAGDCFLLCGKRNLVFRFPFASHARRYPKSGSNGREHCDDDVEDFAPCRIVVECAHNVLCFNYSPQKYTYNRTGCELAGISG